MSLDVRSQGIIDRIKEIELEMSRTQKNKATEYHLGQLKAKLAKLRTQLLEPAPGSAKTAGDGFEVSKYGELKQSSPLPNELRGAATYCVIFYSIARK